MRTLFAWLILLSLTTVAWGATATVSWTDTRNPAAAITGYTIAQSTTTPPQWSTPVQLPKDARSWSGAVGAGTTCYRIVAYAGTVPSDPAEGCATVPFAVEGITVTVTLSGTVK